jgi:hypothetical protein
MTAGFKFNLGKNGTLQIIFMYNNKFKPKFKTKQQFQLHTLLI